MCDTKYVDQAIGAVKAFSGADWAQLGISAAATGLAYYEQKKTAGAVRQAAALTYNAENTALNEQQRQVEAQAMDQAQARSRQAMIERARVRVAAAESGFQAGGTNDRLAAEVSFNEGFDISSIEANKDARVRQVNAERSGAAARYSSTRANAKDPSLLGVALTIAGAGVETAARRSASITPKKYS